MVSAPNVMNGYWSLPPRGALRRRGPFPPIVALCAKRHGQHRSDGVVARGRIAGDADVDFRLRHIDAQRAMQPIPPREYGRPVRVRLVKSPGMRDAGHVWRNE